MLRRTRIPFYATILTTLALGACMHNGESEPGPIATGGEVGSTAQGDRSTEEALDATASLDDGAVDQQERGRRQDKVQEIAAPSPPPQAEPAATEAGPVPVRYAHSKPAPTPHTSRAPIVGGGPMGVGGVVSTTTAPAYRPTSITEMPDVPARVNTEQYTDYGVNGFVATAKDPLSTFSVDVDTASYAITRRKLKEGYLPPASAVRVEEFVNYFPYEYRHPAAGDPFAVDFEATPSPWNPRDDIVRIGVQGRRVAYDRRKPVHLTFLVDISGSMRSPDKLDLVKKSLIMLTGALQDGDTVAIATYAGNTSIVLEPTSATSKKTIEGALQRLTAGGSTAMSSGIDLAYRLADASYAEGSVNRVIVCSDGDANVGPSSHEALSKQIHGYAEKGITLTTLGFGNGNFKDTMMEQLADDGDGNYYYIDSQIEARRVLVDKMTSTMEVIAKDVKIQVDWDPSQVIAYRLIGYENRDIADKDFRNDQVDAGEIGSGHQVTALYEVALADHPTGRLATVRVRNKAPGPDSPAVERSFTLAASAIKDSFGEGSDPFRLAVAAGGFAEILRDSPYMQEVSLRDVEAVARGAQRPEYPEDAELVDLIDRASKLKGEGTYSRR